ncbi:hypothetical protein GC163_02200 [bacterium]|nr:hypothetical protein [bacterium]
MTRINTNVESLRGLRNVQKANNLLSTSLQRLSTGLKINSGKDNPSGLIASETLKLQVTTIEQSIKNSNRANNVIATADSALGEIGGLLNQVRGLVQEGLNTGALSDSEIQANQQQIDAALSAINRISANTTFAGDKLIDGSKAFTTATTTADAAKLSDYQVNEALFGSSHNIALQATVTSAAQKGELHYSGGSLSSATTLQVAGSKGSQVLFLGSGSSVSNIAEAVNGISDVTGVTASVVNSAPGSLTVNNATAGSLAVGNTQAATATLTTAGTINVSRNARAGFAHATSVEGNSQLTVTDYRATATTGDAATLGGNITVTFVNAANSDANSSVQGIDVDANGDYNITIELADDGNGNSIATASDLNAAIAAYGPDAPDGHANGLISFSETQAGGYGTALGTETYGVGVLTLTGGQDTTNNDVTFTDARPVANRGDYNVAVEFVAEAASQALGVTINTNEFGDKTVSITLATNANGDVTSTAADIENLITNDANASALLSATASGNGLGVVQASSPTALNDVTNSHLTITDGRATDETATFTNPLAIVLSNGGASQTLAANFVANGDGGTLTVTLATDANGNVTSTAQDIADLLNNSTDPNLNQYQIEVSGDGSGVVSAAASTDLTGADDLANSDLTFTDARATDSVGEFDTSISVQFANGGANQALGVAVTQDLDGNNIITVNLATDANGNVTSTAADVADFIANDTSSGAVAARALVSVDASGDGTGLVQAKGPQSLTGGDDGANNDVTFTDARTGTQTQAINVAFNDPAANSQSLSVTVGIDGNGDHLITVNLATDANGNVTTTADQLADYINTSSDAGAVAARALVSAEASGDGSGVVADRDAAALSASTGTDQLILTSSDYGSKKFVEVTALSGSFVTTLNDDTTVSSRDAGTDIGVTINGQQALGDGLKASVKTATLDASISFKEANNTEDETATVNITGGGAVFQIGQEVSAAGQIGIGIEAINTAKLGGVTGKVYELGSGNGRSLLDVANGSANAADLVSIIDEALNRVSTLRGRLGSVQKNVIETNITTLGVALENISEARSQIVDTDFAEETAQLQKAQILSQAGLSVVGIANQSPQQVLSLLR